MRSTRLDETWLRTVAEQALRAPKSERARVIAERCSDREISKALETTLGAYSVDDLDTGGALRGALWQDLLGVLGQPDDSTDDTTDDEALEATRREAAGAVPAPSRALGGGARFGRLGRLRIERLLSSGGMGRVYEAYDELLDRRVALKTLLGEQRESPVARARFLREAKLSSQLDHPNVCRLYDLVEDDGVEALVLELIEGQSLKQSLDERALEPDEALRIAHEMASGLAAAHRAGIVHRDLKPANVMLTENDSVKIVDFGIARSEEASAPTARDGPPGQSFSAFKTRHGTTLGTLAYMSPEQARCESVGPESDIYSLGLVLRELFTGSKAYRFENPADLWSKVVDGTIEGYDSLDSGLRSLIDRMLRPEPKDRPDAEEVASALEGLAGRAQLRTRRLAATILLAAAAALATLFWWQDRSSRDAPIFAAGQKPRLAVMPLENKSGDPSLDWVELGLGEMIARGLDETPDLEVVDFALLRSLGNEAAKTEAVANAFGVDLVIRTTLEPVDDGSFRLAYLAERPGFTARERVAAGSDPFAAAREMSASLVRRWSPQALLPDLREVFSGDPFVNRLYAVGLDRLNQQKGRDAESFLRAVLTFEPHLLDVRLRLAQALNYQNEWPEAQEILAEVIEESSERPKVMAAAFDTMASNALGRDAREEAAMWNEKAVQLAESSGDSGHLADTLYGLARTLRFLDPQRASLQLERATELYRAAELRQGEANALHLKGILLEEGGDPEAGTRHFTEALEIARDIGSKRLEAIVLDSLSIVSFATGQFDTGVPMLETAVAINEELGDRRTMIFLLNNLGDGYQELGQVDRAEQTLRRAEALCNEIDAPNPCALLGFNFAELLLVTGRPGEALPLLERSEAFFGEADPDNIWLRGVYAAATGNPQRGRELLESACAAVDSGRCGAYREGFADGLRAAAAAAPETSAATSAAGV